MKNIFAVILMASVSLTCFGMKSTGTISTKDLEFYRRGDNFNLQLNYILDSLTLSRNQQLLVTPIVEGGAGEAIAMPTVLINGRNMHYAYERGTVRKKLNENYDITTEVMRQNGKSQEVNYKASTPFREWMYGEDAKISFRYDTCGCGKFSGADFKKISLNLNPVSQMVTAFVTPKVTELPVSVHEGKARVQFEVNRTELHPEPYKCANGQRIDNRAQLGVIEDSMRYATTDPNVEIARV